MLGAIKQESGWKAQLVHLDRFFLIELQELDAHIDLYCMTLFVASNCLRN